VSTGQTYVSIHYKTRRNALLLESTTPQGEHQLTELLECQSRLLENKDASTKMSQGISKQDL